MSDLVTEMTRIVNTAVHMAQEENRRKGIPNVYSLNGTIIWQLPDGTVTMERPAIYNRAKTTPLKQDPPAPLPDAP